MNQASPLSRWRGIVHPIFWPVFFWNLRGFLRLIQNLREDHPQDGQIAYAVTWWGGIHVEWVHPNDAAPAAVWDSELKSCTRRIRLATLDVFNPYLTPLAQIPAQAGIHGSVSGPGALVASIVHGSLPAQGPAGLAAGAFPQPGHLNTS